MKEHTRINLNDLKVQGQSAIRFRDRLQDSFEFKLTIPIKKTTTDTVVPVVHTIKKNKSNTTTLF